MAYQLPNLNGLRAFEAAARKKSIKEAARELFVTPGAVSQQVKGLEEELGVQLFHRRSNRLELSGSGVELSPVLREAFTSISVALDDIKDRESLGPLTISVLSSFAAKWLVTRLGRFRELHPEIDVRISASDQLVDFESENVDLAIRYGLGDYPGLWSQWLLSEEIFPVCSPALLAGPPPILTPEDLNRYTLLHDEAYSDWEMWLRMHGIQGVNPARGTVFNDAAMVLQAALNSQGVAMTRGELAREDLEQGRLVKPFDLTLPNRSAYYVVCPENRAEWPKVAAFLEWVIAEAQKTRKAPPSRN